MSDVAHGVLSLRRGARRRALPDPLVTEEGVVLRGRLEVDSSHAPAAAAIDQSALVTAETSNQTVETIEVVDQPVTRARRHQEMVTEPDASSASLDGRA